MYILQRGIGDPERSLTFLNLLCYIIADCENDIDIGGANEDLLFAGAKSTGKECQYACQGNTDCDFFVWGGPNSWSPNGCWLKQLKGQNFVDLSRGELKGALSGKPNCHP